MGEKRQAYVAKLKAKIDEWNAEIDRLQSRADQIRSDSRTEYQNQVDALREKRNELEQRVETLRQAGEGAWKELRSGSDRARRAMDKAVRSAAARFRRLGGKESTG